MKNISSFVAILLSQIILSTSFVNLSSKPKIATVSKLNFNIPTFGAKNEDEKENKETEEKKITLSGLFQLITAGAGSPFLGDFEGIDEETGNFMFSLEANNLVDEKGNSKQTQAPYFESGWVSDEDMEKEKKKNEKGGFRFW